MEHGIPYSAIEDISPIKKWETGQKCCFRIVTLESIYLFQVYN